jgi:hypothetical protein
MVHHIKFRPTVHVYYDEDDGQFTMNTDWSDSCDGEYEVDDDGDEVGCGYGDASDQAWDWLKDVMEHYPVLKGYPEPPQHDHGLAWAKINTPEGEIFATGAPLVAGQIAVGQNVPGGYTKLIKLPGGRAFDTCKHYVPTEKELAEGYLVPEDHEWPYNTYLPYGACTNKKLVGPAGLGPCQMAGAVMPKCNGYEVEEPVILGEHPKATTDGPTPVVITRRRVALGRPEWTIKVGDNDPEVIQGETVNLAHANAILRYQDLTGQLPTNPIKVPKQGTPFVAEMVGANVE